MEAAHRGIEIGDPQRTAHHRNHRQAGLSYTILYQLALPCVDLDRIGRDIYRIETDVPGQADALRRPHRRAEPRRIKQPELHVVPPCRCRPDAPYDARQANDSTPPAGPSY